MAHTTYPFYDFLESHETTAAVTTPLYVFCQNLVSDDLFFLVVLVIKICVVLVSRYTCCSCKGN